MQISKTWSYFEDWGSLIYVSSSESFRNCFGVIAFFALWHKQTHTLKYLYVSPLTDGRLQTFSFVIDCSKQNRKTTKNSPQYCPKFWKLWFDSLPSSLVLVDHLSKLTLTTDIDITELKSGLCKLLVISSL